VGRLGLGEILLIAVVILLLFGAKDLPKIGKAIGEALKEFKKSFHDTTEGDQ
jgi:sec-independent protein translocase protein TatA